MMDSSQIARRSFLTLAAGGALWAQAPGRPPRDWTGREPVPYPDPDVVALDRRFRKYIITNTPIKRLFTGTLWAEGTAWSGAGRFLVWSDIPNNVQYRWLEEDGHVSVYHKPSNNSNGNTFDYEGRQLSCEHGNRRVVRYEPDGKITVIASAWQAKPLNSPNDIVVAPDGAIWFTDPDYGIQGNYEGDKNPPQLKEAVYRVDAKAGTIDKLTDEIGKPNGICFSPDYKRLYVTDTGEAHNIKVWDVADGRSLRNGKVFTVIEGGAVPDGARVDLDGNLWTGAGQGVQVFTPEGEKIGVIRLPETCANLCFGGTKRNRVFMAASQSLYAVYVNTAGAHIA
jgi:gluconolactonase